MNYRIGSQIYEIKYWKEDVARKIISLFFADELSNFSFIGLHFLLQFIDDPDAGILFVQRKGQFLPTFPELVLEEVSLKDQGLVLTLNFGNYLLRVTVLAVHHCRLVPIRSQWQQIIYRQSLVCVGTCTVCPNVPGYCGLFVNVASLQWNHTLIQGAPWKWAY